MNNKKIIAPIYTCAVGLVILGMCLRFGGEKFVVDWYLKKYNDSPDQGILKLVKYSGVALYIIGWLAIAICLSLKHKGNKILKNSIFSIIVISAIWAVFEYREDVFILQPKLPLISCSILLSALVALISLKYEIKEILIIVAASSLIILSEFFILPFQRNNTICDGIGAPLLILGWFLLFYVFNQEPKVLDTILKDVNIPLVDMSHRW